MDTEERLELLIGVLLRKGILEVTDLPGMPVPKNPKTEAEWTLWEQARKKGGVK